MEWKFNKLRDDESRVNPNLDEFFITKEEAFRDFSESLIREDVQNRLDAKNDAVPSHVPVRVRYFLSTSGERSEEKIARWFGALEEHCGSRECLQKLFSAKPSCFHNKLRYLTIECFNTTGLVGNPAEVNEGKCDMSKNDFYWMFRNVGRSGKARLKGKRGSWGVGKAVYHMASDTFSFFCYSISKERFTLMGKTQLLPHWIGEDGYNTDGFFCVDGPDGTAPMPFTDIHCETARQFREDFGITRGDSECGTSTVIPFCVKELEKRHLVKSAIKSYIWEIVKGRVRIEIESDDGDPKVELYAGSVKDDIENYFSDKTDDERAEKEKYLAFVDFYEKIIAARRGQAKIQSFELRTPSYISKALAEVKANFGNALVFENAKKAYKNGDIVAVKANVAVTIKKGDTSEKEIVPASFDVYLQKDEMERPQVSMIRDGLAILDLPRRQDSLFRALTLIEPPEGDTRKDAANPLSEFIRAAESPAHADLSYERKSLKKFYDGGQALLKYISTLMYTLAVLFTDVTGTIDEAALLDFFSFDADDKAGESKRKRRRRRSHKTSQKLPPKSPIPHKPSIFKIMDRWPSGVKIVSDSTPDEFPRRLGVNLAYAVEGAVDPLKRYDLADFDCREGGTVHIQATGCRPVQRNPNRVVFEITEAPFAIEMTGFDPKRDIHVDAKEVKVPREVAEAGAEATAEEVEA